MTTPNDIPKPVTSPKPKVPKASGLDWKASVARAAHWNGLPHDSEMCDAYTQESILGHSGVYGSAKEHYNTVLKRGTVYTSAPPAGVSVFYKGSEFGHAAVSAGGGYVYSTDINGNRIGKVPYNKVWGGHGAGQFLGWSPDIQTRKGGGWTHVNYDRSTVGKAPRVAVATASGAPAPTPNTTPNPEPNPEPKPTPNPEPNLAPSPEESNGPVAGTVNLSSLAPGAAPQFSGVSKVAGAVSIPKVG